jgi:hypothetical protein
MALLLNQYFIQRRCGTLYTTGPSGILSSRYERRDGALVLGDFAFDSLHSHSNRLSVSGTVIGPAIFFVGHEMAFQLDYPGQELRQGIIRHSSLRVAASPPSAGSFDCMRNIAPRLGGRHVKQRVRNFDIIKHETRRRAAELVGQNHRNAFDVVEIVCH